MSETPRVNYLFAVRHIPLNYLIIVSIVLPRTLSGPTHDGGRLRDFYHYCRNSILQQVEIKLLELRLWFGYRLSVSEGKPNRRGFLLQFDPPRRSRINRIFFLL